MEQQGKFILVDINEFKDWVFKQKFIRQIKLIQVHHTWEPSYDNFHGDNHFSLVKNMENYHVRQAGFSQIAQNITVYPDGKIMICRDFNIMPAGIKGNNQYGLCIENIGNFDIGKDQMTEEHKEVIVKLIAILCKRFNIEVSTKNIVYHSWFNLTTGQRDNDAGKVDKNHKSCPGSQFFSGNSAATANHEFIPLILKALSEVN
jgi:hypothetical protein